MVCDKADTCLTLDLWKRAAKAMYNELGSITLHDLLGMGKKEEGVFLGQAQGDVVQPIIP